MAETQIQISWEPDSRKKYELMISKIPLFHREIARQVVEKKSSINAQSRSSEFVQEEDIVRAFLTEVPMTFYSLMVRLFEEVGFDWEQYDENGG